MNSIKRFQLYQQDKVKQLQIQVLVKFLETIEGCLFANSCSNTWAGLILFLPLSWKHLIMKVFELVPKIWIFVGCCWSQAAATGLQQSRFTWSGFRRKISRFLNFPGNFGSGRNPGHPTRQEDRARQVFGFDFSIKISVLPINSSGRFN